MMIREDLKGPTSLDLSVNFIFDNRFWVGCTYRTGAQLWKKSYTERAIIEQFECDMRDSAVSGFGAISSRLLLRFCFKQFE